MLLPLGLRRQGFGGSSTLVEHLPPGRPLEEQSSKLTPTYKVFRHIVEVLLENIPSFSVWQSRTHRCKPASCPCLLSREPVLSLPNTEQGSRRSEPRWIGSLGSGKPQQVSGEWEAGPAAVCQLGCLSPVQTDVELAGFTNTAKR